MISIILIKSKNWAKPPDLWNPFPSSHFQTAELWLFLNRLAILSFSILKLAGIQDECDCFALRG
jgi:hypothetical protein